MPKTRIIFETFQPNPWQDSFFRAYVEGKPECNGVGPDPDTALGRLCFKHPDVFSVELDTHILATADDR